MVIEKPYKVVRKFRGQQLDDHFEFITYVEAEKYVKKWMADGQFELLEGLITLSEIMAEVWIERDQHIISRWEFKFSYQYVTLFENDLDFSNKDSQEFV